MIYWYLARIAYLNGCSGWIDLDFVESERTPPGLMKPGIRLHLEDYHSRISSPNLRSSASSAVRTPSTIGWRKPVHSPQTAKAPNQIAVDETMIRIEDDQYWLCAAVDPATNHLLHIQSLSAYTTSLTQIFLQKLRKKHDVETSLFLVDDATHHQTALDRACLRFRYEPHRNRNSAKLSSVEENAEPPCSATASATSNQKSPKQGFKPSPAGKFLTKHYRSGASSNASPPPAGPARAPSP